MKNNNIEKTEFLKIVYFDEAAAQDYVDVTNGGRLDWSTQENKEKIAKIVAEIEAQAKSGFNILNYIKATFQGKVDASASAELTSAFDKTIKNTLLTDYIQAASKDEHVKKFENSGVYAPENSVTLYKMLSSYLTIVPKEEIPIDMEKLNEAILGERGYYDMLLKTEKERKSILRFNLQAFKNNYNLVDLSKMKLTYFGIKVGTCGENHLSIDKEFDFQPAEDKTTAEEIVEGEKSVAEEEKELDVYDIVLAGVKKIEIFVGSDSAFEKIVPKSARNLSEMAAKLDDGNKKMDVFVNIPGQPEPKLKKKKKPRVQDFVIHADEYCSVQEHVIINFINFIFQMSITNMYIQNPPKNIREQIYRTFDKSIIHETQQPYLEVSKEMIQTFNSQYSERVIGQERAKKKLLQAIYPLVDGKQSKPVVILLYGDSGLGKTESAQYMAELMGGKLLRKQFSMYQNNESANYIFGGRYNEKSFAQDLLARETNVLLFDEFDKALSVFHSAFYQLFDEGIYEDHNYKVVVNKAIIVCTSNYKTIDEIKEHLGLPIYNRFDSIIKFDDLPDMAKEKIAEREIERLKKDYDIEDRELFDKIKEGAVTQSNAREIKHLIKETFSLVALKKICGETEI